MADTFQHIADVLSAPMEQVILALGRGVASAQQELDRHALATEREISEDPLLAEAGFSTAASLARANAALDQEASPGSSRWTIAEMSTEIRGVLTARGGEIALRVPLPEQPLSADQLGAVRLTLRQSPRAATVPAPAAVMSSDVPLRDALVRLQATAARWPPGRGATASQRMVEQATILLGLPPDRLDEMIPVLAELRRGAAALAQQARGTTLRAHLEPYREALKRLETASAELQREPAASGPHAVAVAASVAELTAVLERVIGGPPGSPPSPR